MPADSPAGAVRSAPNASPHGATSESDITVADHGVRRVVLLFLVALVLLQRLAITVGPLQVSLLFLVVLALLLQASRRDLAAFDGVRWSLLFGLVVVSSLAGLACLVSGRTVSLPSTLAFLAASSVFVLGPIASSRDRRRIATRAILDGFLILGLVIAALVALQWVVQRLTGSYLDPVSMLPSAALLEGYNTRALLEYGSTLSRPNGMFFLEPSLASQFLGLATLSILLHPWLPSRRRYLAAAATCLALLLTVSGTGLLLLGAGWVAARKPVGLLKSALVAVPILVLLFSVVNPRDLGAGVLLDRVDEFSSPETSGNLRFVRPYQIVRDEAFGGPTEVLVGQGAASADARSEQDLTSAGGRPLFNTVLKAYWEYGLLATILLGALAIHAVRGMDPTLRAIGWAALVQYLVLSSNLVFPGPPATIALLALCIGTVGDRRPRSCAPAGTRHYGARRPLTSAAR